MFLKDLTDYELSDRYIKANWYLKKFFVEVRELEEEMDRRKMIEYPFSGECEYKEKK